MQSNLREMLDQEFVEVFDLILDDEERYLKQLGVNLTLKEVHLLAKIDLLSKQKQLVYPKDLIESLNITKGTLSIATTKLIKKNYVIKNNVLNDKRKIHFSLADEAIDVVKKHNKWHEQLINNVVSEIDENQAKALYETLKIINKNLKK